MASHLVGPVIGGGKLVESVDAIAADIPDPNTRELLRSFARVRTSGGDQAT